MLADRYLETYATESLKIMARRRGLHEAGAAPKAELIAFLAPRLFSREANRRLVQSLPARQLQLLGALKARNCRANTIALAATVEGEGGEVVADLRELLELGLLLYPAEGRPLKYRLGECDHVWMDRTTADAMDPIETAGVVPKLLAQSPAETREGHLGLLLADLLLFTLEIERQPFRPARSAAHLSDGEWDALGRRLLVRPDETAKMHPGGPGRLLFLYTLLDEAGLLKVKNGRLVPGESAAPFFHLPRSRQARTLFDTFKRLRSWNEFLRVPELVGCPLPDRETQDHVPSPGRVARARARVLAALRRFDPECWYAFSSLRREIKTTHPQFLIRRRDSLTAGHRYRGFGELGRGGTALPLDLTADWDRVEGRFIARVLLEPLFWFGIVDLGFAATTAGKDRRLDSFQITREGAYLLGVSNALPRRRAGAKPLVVQPDFDVLCLSPDPDTSLLYDLSRFADFTGGDRVVRFSLSREGANRGFHDGWNTERIVTRLEEQAVDTVPQNVRSSLRSWEQAYRRFRIVRGVTLVEDPDNLVADVPDLVTADASTTQIGSGLWRMSRAAAAGLVRRLRENGKAIRRFDYEARPGHGLTLGPGLRIRRGKRGEDWVTDALLTRCAVPSSEDPQAFTLDRRAVIATQDRGLCADTLLEMLEARSPTTSPEIRVALQAWAGGAGEVAVGQVPLFVCQDPELMQRILATPALAGCLAERLGENVFAVARGQTAAFRKLLLEVGVQLASGPRERRTPTTSAPAQRADSNRVARQRVSTRRSSANRTPRGQPRYATVSGAVGKSVRSPADFTWHREHHDLHGPAAETALQRLLLHAIEGRRPVRMLYRASGQTADQREVFPLRLDGRDLLAYCNRRSVQRTYRVDRIVALEVLPGRR